MIEENKRIPTATSELNIDILSIFRVILARKRALITFVVTTTIGTGILSLFIPNTYEAKAVILPVENSSSNGLASIVNSMGGGLGLIANQAGLTGDYMGEKLVTLLNTRTLRESVIQKTDLLPILLEHQWDSKQNKWKNPTILGIFSNKNIPSMQEALDLLDKNTKINKEKTSNVISISFSAKDPNIAAKVANAFVDELNKYIQSNSLTAAKRNRVFIEEQLSKTRSELSDYESAINNFNKKNQVVSLGAQTEAAVKAYVDLKAQLIQAEVELGIMKNSSFADDPRVTLKNQQITELRKQLTRLEKESEGPMLSFKNAPDLSLTFGRLKRELLVREKVFEMLTQQFEIAKINESKEEISFQILDPAIAPEKKSRPKRSLIVATAFAVYSAIGIFFAILHELWQNRIKNTPIHLTQ